MKVACLNCGRPYPEKGAPHRCPVCGGLYDYAEPLRYEGANAQLPGIWRYGPPSGLEWEPVSLGEGQTPLREAKAFRRKIYFKCENENPTGSFKDRGEAALVAFLRSRGVTEAIEDSSGNAGASFAAYAQRAGIKARVFAPESTTGAKQQLIQAYGAGLELVTGPRSNAAEAARKAAEAGAVYGSHAYLPFNLPGYATCAYEIVEQLGKAVGTVVVPAGQGGLLLGLARGFQVMVAAGRLPQMPALLGVQAAACAPLVALFDMGLMGLNFVTEGATVAEGVRVRSPLRAEAVLRAVGESGGRMLSIEEQAILPGRDALRRLGFYVEPTSALVWQAIEEMPSELSDPVVAVLTGSEHKPHPKS